MVFNSITDLILDDRLGARPGSPPYLGSTSSSTCSSPGACGGCASGLLLSTSFPTSGQGAPIPPRNSEQQLILKMVTVKVNATNKIAWIRAFRAIARLDGVEEIAPNSTRRTFTVIGQVDPVTEMLALRKMMLAELVSVGPAPADRKVQRQNFLRKLKMWITIIKEDFKLLPME